MTVQIVYQFLNVLIGAMVLGIFIMSWFFFMRWQNTKQADGKILCHFFGPAGWYYMLCDHDGNLIKPPEGHKVQGNYLITNDCLFGGKWKPGQPKWAQVGVQTTAYIENVREPIVSTEPDKWIASPDKYKITAIMEQHAINESAMKVAAALQTGVWKDIANMAQFIKRVPLMFLISIGTLFLMLLVLYFNYTIVQQVGSLRAILGG